jgi:hypothetical protein
MGPSKLAATRYIGGQWSGANMHDGHPALPPPTPTNPPFLPGSEWFHLSVVKAEAKHHLQCAIGVIRRIKAGDDHPIRFFQDRPWHASRNW